MLDLVFQNLTGDKLFDKNFFSNIFNIAVGEVNLSQKNIGISVNLVDENKIQELNKKYRNKDKVTDVLSFPMLDDNSKNLKPKTYNPGFVDIGDIFICLPFAKNQAKLENVSIERKLAQLVVHGFLHLLGYKHERSRSDAKRMFGLEANVMDKLDLD